MITAQDIREKTFDKATFGGYDMSGVDDFLEALAADVTSTQKEIGTLRGKIKVLVDKIEEYRAYEDAMRKALVSAQKLAIQIEEDAKEDARKLIEEAQQKADELAAQADADFTAATAGISAACEKEELRLKTAKGASAAYFEKTLAELEKQREYILSLQAADAEENETEEAGEEEPITLSFSEELPIEAFFASAEESAPEEVSAVSETVPEEVPAVSETAPEGMPAAEENAASEESGADAGSSRILSF